MESKRCLRSKYRYSFFLLCLQKPTKLTTADRFKLTMCGRMKLTTADRVTFQISTWEKYLEIYNVLGEKVYNKTLRQAQGDIKINLSGQAKGLYLYRIISEKGEDIANGKFIIE